MCVGSCWFSTRGNFVSVVAPTSTRRVERENKRKQSSSRTHANDVSSADGNAFRRLIRKERNARR